MQNEKLKAIRGFTLIELLVVIAIISLLSSIILASLGQAREKAKIAKVQQELAQIRTAMYLFLGDHTELPPTDDAPIPPDPGERNCSACMGQDPPDNADYVCKNNSGGLVHGWATKNSGYPGDGGDGVMDELKPYLSSPINVDPWGNAFCYDDNYIDLGRCDQPTVLWSMGPNGWSDTYQEPFNNGGFLVDDIGIALYDPSCS